MHVRCLKEERKSNVRCRSTSAFDERLGARHKIHVAPLPLPVGARCGSHFLGLNITYKAAKTGRMRQSLEIGIPLFLGKGEAGLRITSLRRLVADQKGDRRSAKGGGFSCRKRMIDQCLHQSASSMQGQRRDVFDKPVVLAPLYPAA